MSVFDVAVLFSGGMDSSLVACIMAEKFEKIALLHYNNNCVLTKQLYQIRKAEICNAFTMKQIELYNINIGGIFRKISLKNIEEDIPLYKKNLICLGCRMAMHAETIIFSKQHDIKHVVDGSTLKQNRYPEQSASALSFFKNYYSSHDIDYENPIYSYEKKQIKYELLDRSISIQSLEDTCIFSNTFSTAPEETIEQYIKDKIHICTYHLNRRLGNHNEDD